MEGFLRVMVDAAGGGAGGGSQLTLTPAPIKKMNKKLSCATIILAWSTRDLRID